MNGAAETYVGMAETRHQLPAGWRWVRLGDVCEEAIPALDPLTQPTKTFRYVDITSVDNKTKRIVVARQLLGRDAPSRARQVIRTGDVILATTRPSLNAVTLVPPDLDGQICSTGFCVLRAKDGLDPGFLFGFVRTKGFVETLSCLVSGAMYPAVTDRQVKAQLIPLPPLEEQKRIVAILNEEITAIERARVAAGSQLQAATALPVSYLRAVFSNAEASAWPRRRLVDIATLLPSTSLPVPAACQTRTITTARLSEICFRAYGIKLARMWQHDALASAASAGEILIARSNTPELVGRAALFRGEPEGVVASDLTIRVRMNEGFSPEFVAAYLSFLFTTGYWEERAGGASGSMKKITRSQVQAEHIPAPSPDVQSRIAVKIADKINGAKRLISSVEEELSAVSALPDALLRRAFDGGL